jgi:hypothetical protein
MQLASVFDKNRQLHWWEIPIWIAVIAASFAVMFSLIFAVAGGVETVHHEKTISANQNEVRRQDFARTLADEFVKQNDTMALRLWAASHNLSEPELASAATIREDIARESNNFALYRDEAIFTDFFAAILGTSEQNAKTKIAIDRVMAEAEGKYGFSPR